jgi:hypothetical protein
MNHTSSVEELIIKPERLNRIGLIFAPVILILFLSLFYLIKGWNNLIEEWNFFSKWFLPIIILGTLIHEGLHGLICGIYAPHKFKSVKFGFSKAMLSPYTHCSETLKGWQYALSLVAPGVILGIIPFLIAIFSLKNSYLFIGIIFTWGALGDFTVLWSIRNKIKHTHIQDHPSMAGCFIYYNKNNL